MMQDRMTAAEYRKQFVDPALKEEDGDQEFLKQLQKVDKKTKFQTRTGVAVFEGGKKVKEINSEWQPVKKPRNDEEDQITIQVAEYCELLMVQKKIQCYSHIPQETFTKSWVTKNKNKAMGVRAGVPDMLIVFPNTVLFLELKRLKGGKVSDSQKAWIEALNKVEEPALNSSHRYVVACVAAGFDEAKRAIDNLLD